MCTEMPGVKDVVAYLMNTPYMEFQKKLQERLSPKDARELHKFENKSALAILGRCELADSDAIWMAMNHPAWDVAKEVFQRPLGADPE